MLKRGIEIRFLVIILLQDYIFSPILIQNIERIEKIVVIEYVSSENNRVFGQSREVTSKNGHSEQCCRKNY